MARDFEAIIQDGTRQEKVRAIEAHENTDDPAAIAILIEELDDADMQVRGEAWGALVYNENNIAKYLIDALKSNSRYKKAFCALALANRKDSQGVVQIAKLTQDDNALVRSCALGALGFLKVKESLDEIRKCFSDTDLDVKKSALQTAADVGYTFSESDIEELKSNSDSEIKEMLRFVK